MSQPALPSTSCPLEETLVAFVSNALASAERRQCEAHLAGCNDCLEVVRVLAAAAAPEALAGAPVLARGTPLGRYLVLERVGAGAMGVVYAAYDPELDRRVAVKLLHATLQGGESAWARSARLKREAQALARLSHPHVVSVFDVGAQGELVYLTMEWVDGVTLRQWLEQQARPWREVLELLCSAGEGLAAAHATGLIHRDFKPDNVMVGRDGRVRVADFGLARLTGGPEPVSGGVPEVLLGYELTRTGAVVGTPAYMPPELRQGAPASELSDQYAFCVAAWEALAGQRPLAGEARPPAARPGPPAGVWRVLQRGLGTQPGERYPSMEALLVALRAASTAPVRRRRALLAGTLGVLLLVPAGWVLRTYEQARASLCPEPAGHLSGIWDEPARLALAQAFQASGKPYAASALRSTQAALDAYVEEWGRLRQGACRATRVLGEQSEEVLGLKMACLDRRLLELRALAGVLREADGAVVQSAVNAAGSLTPLATCEDVEALRAEVKPPGDAGARQRVAQVREQLAHVEALVRAGKYHEAEAAGGPLVSRARALGYAPLLAEALFLTGFSREKRYDTVPAAADLEEAVWHAHASRHDVYAARASIRLAAVQFKDSRWEQAAAWARYARAAVQRLGGARQLEAELENVLGAGASIQFEERLALEHFTRAHVLAREALGPEHPETLTYQGNAVLTLLYTGRILEARAGLRQVRPLQERYLGPTHPQLTYLLTSLFHTHSLLGEHAEASAVVARLREVVEEGYRPGSSPWVWMLQDEGRHALGAGRDADALERFEQAERMLAGAFGDNPDREAEAVALTGRALVRLGRAREALRRLEAACRPGPGAGAAGAFVYAVECLPTLADAQEALGQSVRALALREQALRTIIKLQGAEHFHAAGVRVALAQGLTRMGRVQEALAHAAEAEAVLQAALGERGPLLAQARRARGEALLALGRAREALPTLERAARLAAQQPLAPLEAAHLHFAHARALRDTGAAQVEVRAAAEAALAAHARAERPDEAARARVHRWLSRRAAGP